MTTREYKMSDLQGFTPALDATESERLYVLRGENYSFSSLGVHSPFGNRLVTTLPRNKPQGIHGTRIAQRGLTRTFTFDGDGIWEWDEALGVYRAIHLPNVSLGVGKWTHAYLAGYYYFARAGVGLLALDAETGICYRHESIGIGTPTNVVAIDENNGRLIVVTTDLFMWSAASDGLDFEPKLGGAGFQVISERVSGDVITGTAYKGGFLTWTTGGVMRSEFTGDAAVYRHRVLATDYQPVNSHCAAKFDGDSIVVLDRRGLFVTKGDAPTPFAPLFNEFLLDYVKRNRLNVGQNMRIDWDEVSRTLFLLVSTSYASPLYERVFVLYQPLDKWGEFNESTYGLLPISFPDSNRAGDYFGFVDSNGLVHYWDAVGSREQLDSTANQSRNLVIGEVQKPMNQQIGEEAYTEVSSTATLNTVAATDHGVKSGYYAAGAVTYAQQSLSALNAWVILGLVRLATGEAPDSMSEVQSVIVRNLEIGDATTQEGEYNNSAPVGVVDLRVNPAYPRVANHDLEYIQHGLVIHGTVDGHAAWQSEEPRLVAHSKASQNYTCAVIGIWHMVEINALVVGHAFNLRTLGLAASYAGRYI